MRLGFLQCLGIQLQHQLDFRKMRALVVPVDGAGGRLGCRAI